MHLVKDCKWHTNKRTNKLTSDRSRQASPEECHWKVIKRTVCYPSLLINALWINCTLGREMRRKGQRENPCRLWTNLSLSVWSKWGGSSHYSPNRRWMGESGREAGPLCWQTDPHKKCVCTGVFVQGSQLSVYNRYSAMCCFCQGAGVQDRLHAGIRSRAKRPIAGLYSHSLWRDGGWMSQLVSWQSLPDTENTPWMALNCIW